MAKWKKEHKSIPAIVRRLDKIADRLAELDQQLEGHADSCDDAQLEDVELVCKERSCLLREQEVLEVCIRRDITFHGLLNIEMY